MEGTPKAADGTSFLCTFPFWLFVTRQDPPGILEAVVGETPVRFYPPFRSGAPNFLPMPYPRLTEVPFVDGTRPEIDSTYSPPQVAAIPQLERPKGDAGIILVWGEFEEEPEPFPMDSMRIDVLAPEEAAQQCVENVIPALLSQLRIRTRQWWIGHSIHGLAGLLRQTFGVLENGKPTEAPAARASARTVTGNELGVNSRLWREAVDGVSKGAELPVYHELLLDGSYFAAVRDYRRAVIDLAISCEQAKEETFRRLWESRAGAATYRRGRILSGYDLPEHIDVHLRDKFGRSLKDEHPGVFVTIAELWDARGNVAHGSGIIFRRNGTEVKVGEEQCKQFSSAAERCIDWLDSLT